MIHACATGQGKRLCTLFVRVAVAALTVGDSLTSDWPASVKARLLLGKGKGKKRKTGKESREREFAPEARAWLPRGQKFGPVQEYKFCISS